jgi:hypothetical protein
LLSPTWAKGVQAVWANGSAAWSKPPGSRAISADDSGGVAGLRAARAAEMRAQEAGASDDQGALHLLFLKG